jgi:hypothetical protein
LVRLLREHARRPARLHSTPMVTSDNAFESAQVDYSQTTTPKVALLQLHATPTQSEIQQQISAYPLQVPLI